MTNSAGVPLGRALSNRFNPEIVREIRSLRDILSGVNPEKKAPKRRFENSHRAILRGRISNRGQEKEKIDRGPTIILSNEDLDKGEKLAA